MFSICDILDIVGGTYIRTAFTHGFSLAVGINMSDARLPVCCELLCVYVCILK